MSLLALILGCFMTGSTVLVCPNPPLDTGLVAQTPTPVIQHTGYSSWDNRQLMVQRAYELGGLDFVLMLECESGFNPYAKWDSGRSHGLCQMNTRRHELPQEYFDSWEYQIEYCYTKRKWWTKFYGPNRKIKWVKCSTAVRDRFIING